MMKKEYLFIVIIPFCLYLLRFPLSLLNIANVSPVLHGDYGLFIVGEHILRNTSLTFPFFHSDLAHYPSGCPMIYTTIGFFSFFTVPLSKIFDSILPQHIQIQGWQFLFACYGLFCVAYIIFKKFEFKSAAALAAATLLCLFPPFFASNWAGSMSWHFVILLGLFVLFFSKSHVYLKCSLLNGFALSLHTYFLPILLCFTVFKPYYDSDGVFTVQTAKKSFIALFWSFLVVFCYAYVIGYFGTKNAFLVNTGFGYYSMNLNAIINSQGWSRVLLPMPLGTHGQYEGFQYVGLGLMFFITASFMFAKQNVFSKNRCYILLSISVLFILVALSCKVYLGSVLIVEYVVGFLEVLFSTVRSSGRLFWPVAYIVIIVACVKAYKSFSTKTFYSLIVLSILIQVADVRFNTNSPIVGIDSASHNDSQDIELDNFLKSLSEKPKFLELNFWSEAINSHNNYKAILTSIDHKIPVTRLYTARGGTYKNYKQFNSYGDSINNGGIVLLDAIDLGKAGEVINVIQYCSVGSRFVAISEKMSSSSFECKKISTQNITLENLLPFFADKTIAISVADEAVQNLKQYPKFMGYMKSLGSNIDALAFRQSYIAIINEGKLSYENFSNNTIEYFEVIKGKHLKIISQGLLTGASKSSLLIDNKEYSPNLRGLNFVIFDENNAYSAHYDTYAPRK